MANIKVLYSPVLTSICLVLIASLPLKAETSENFWIYAQEYAVEKGVELTEDAETVILEGIEASIDEINTRPNGADDARAAIRVLVNELMTRSLDASTSDESKKLRLILALVSICPIWPLCE